MSVIATTPVRNLGRRLTPGDLINIIVPALESEGFDFCVFDEADLVVRSGATTVNIDFEIAHDEPDDNEPDEDLSSWENDDGHWELGPYTQTADTGLTADEDELKREMKPFSRNLDVAAAQAIGRALDGYDALRRASL